jgi:hypothetical protein
VVTACPEFTAETVGELTPVRQPDTLAGFGGPTQGYRPAASR